MAQIRIDTQRVRDVGRQFRSNSDQINDINNALQSVINSLDTWAWDGRSRADAEPMLDQVRPESGNLGDGLERLGKVLLHIADRFENEDGTAARGLQEISWMDFAKGTGIDLRVFDLGFLKRLLPFLIIGPLGINAVTISTTFCEGFRNWLFGGDWIKHKKFEGSVFKGERGYKGIHLDDIHQGSLGDCYLIAGMGAIANTDPELIEKMIHDNGDGTYTVTFHVTEEINGEFIPTGKTEQITVDGTFPTKDGKRFAYGHSNDEGELWPAIVEKAYAKWKGGEGDYEDIVGGFSGKAMVELTGSASRRVFTKSKAAEELRQEIQQALDNGHPVAAGGGTISTGRPFYAQHAYVVEKIYQDGEGIWRVDLHNPHGEAGTHPNPPLTIDEFKDMLGVVYISNA